MRADWEAPENENLERMSEFLNFQERLDKQAASIAAFKAEFELVKAAFELVEAELASLRKDVEKHVAYSADLTCVREYNIQPQRI